MRFIGDIHGKVLQYNQITREVDETIQVGDFGAGFLPGLPDDYHDVSRSYWIRGNHDSPAVCRQSKSWLPDGSVKYYGKTSVMFVGGAGSIDRFHRTEGIDWWPDEELSDSEMEVIKKTYAIIKPDVMVTHDCPEFVANIILNKYNWKKYDIGTRTRYFLSSLFEIHKPKLHIFGHWHINLDYVLENTRFVCLNELNYIDIDLEGDLSAGTIFRK